MRGLLTTLVVALAVLFPQIGMAADGPVINKYTFSDNAIAISMSENGDWAIAQSGQAATLTSVLPRIINVRTNEVVEIMTKEEHANAAVEIADVTNDGNIVVCSLNDKPAYWVKSTRKWVELPIPAENTGGMVTAITGDGKYAVGSATYTDVYQEKPMMWDVENGKIIEIKNLPTLDKAHINANQQRFTNLSPDGRYIVARMSFSYPGGQSCSYVFDRQTGTSKFLGFTASDTKDWTPDYPGIFEVEDPVMSPNGLYVASPARILRNVNGTEEEYITVLKYDITTGKTEVYDGLEDRDKLPSAIDNYGNVYAATPTSTPIREWSVRHGNYWYDISDILSQKYGINFYDKTGYTNTGHVFNISEDAKTFLVMVSPTGESYSITLPEKASDICTGINLLDNYTITPAVGQSFTNLKTIEITFDRNVSVLGDKSVLALKDESGATVKQPSSFKQSTSDPKTVNISFLRAVTMEAGKKYTMEIPAGTICIEGDETKTNNAIIVEYTGRADKAVEVTNIYPANNSEISKIDNSSNPVILTFDANITVAENATAELINVGENRKLCDMIMIASENRLAVFPATTQYLFLGNDYKVVVHQGAVTDITGSGASAELTINYKGTYERTISHEDATLFSDDFSNTAQSFINFMRFEGDHNAPTVEMQGLGFDKDNQPWNFSIRDNAQSKDFCAASHSMYTPAGKSDDWMMIPQITIPDEYCVLTFDAQSYIASKNDVLKVVVWTSDDIINDLNSVNMETIKKECETVFSERLTDGGTKDKIEGEWKNYTVDLAKFNGKNIYIAFVNDNENQSAIFVDNVVVKRNMKYLLSLSNDQSVVDKSEINIAGTVTANSDTDTFSTIALTLTDAQGTEIDKITESGLALKKGDTYSFTFNKPLKLTKGENNVFQIKVELDNYKDVVKSGIKSLAFEPYKRIVIEEMTGITCPNCPLGILAMENLEKNFGDRIIPIALHTYTGDPYGAGLETYAQTLGLGAAPTAVVNRNGNISSPMFSTRGKYYFTNGKDLWLDYVEQELKTPADAEINASVDVNEATGKFSVPVSVRYALNAKSLSLNLFLVLVEDDIIASQENNLGTVNDATLLPWSSGGANSGSTVFNVSHKDVARAYLGNSFTGIGGYLPQSMTAGEVYTTTIENITIPETISNLKKTKAVVMMFDANTDKIINSVCVKFPGYVGGIENVNSDNSDCKVYAKGGYINVDATGMNTVNVYSAAGTLIASESAYGTVSLAVGGFKGTAIVKVTGDSGSTVKKINVR